MCAFILIHFALTLRDVLPRTSRILCWIAGPNFRKIQENKKKSKKHKIIMEHCMYKDFYLLNLNVNSRTKKDPEYPVMGEGAYGVRFECCTVANARMRSETISKESKWLNVLKYVYSGIRSSSDMRRLTKEPLRCSARVGSFVPLDDY